MYRDAEEIEREKVLLVCGTDASGTFQYYLCMLWGIGRIGCKIEIRNFTASL